MINKNTFQAGEFESALSRPQTKIVVLEKAYAELLVKKADCLENLLADHHAEKTEHAGVKPTFFLTGGIPVAGLNNSLRILVRQINNLFVADGVCNRPDHADFEMRGGKGQHLIEPIIRYARVAVQ